MAGRRRRKQLGRVGTAVNAVKPRQANNLSLQYNPKLIQSEANAILVGTVRFRPHDIGRNRRPTHTASPDITMSLSPSRMIPFHARQVDQFVKDFEAAWTAGEQPCVAEFLGRVDKKERDGLLARLLPIDIERVFRRVKR